MAMLQFGGTLSNVTVRITPRISWWITAQHLLSASSLSTIPNPIVENIKSEKVARKPLNNRQTDVNTSLITAAFKSLLEPSKQNEEQSKTINAQLNQKINDATSISELLNISNDPAFNSQNAYNVVYVLCNWMTTGKIKIEEIENDMRYLKVCKILGIRDTKKKVVKYKQLNLMDDYTAPLHGLIRLERNKSLISDFSTHEIIKVLSSLAIRQTRSLPFLKVIAQEITNSKEELNIKKLADILYSVAVLNFYDDLLMQKISKDLSLVISTNEKNAIIGSILTSFGILRYRNDDLLDLLSSWIVKHKNLIRPHEISSLMVTLAHVGYIPKNFDELSEQVILPLKESEMCQSSEWLDIVWSLTVLNKANHEQYVSVLNDGFLNRISHNPETEISKAFKLLNVNAAARLIMKDYSGPLLPEDSKLFDITILKAKEKASLANSVISALKILLPSDSIYLNVDINTKMGFLLDAEFCVDSNCTPLPMNSETNEDKPVFRIAVLTCAYHEFCRGTNTYMLGSVNLRKTLLEKQGYKVLLIPYTEVNIKDKLVQRVKYINDSVKIIVGRTSKQ